MRAAFFFKERQPDWNRCEALIKKVQSSGLRSLQDSEIRELAHLYQGITIDVSRARMYKLDPVLQDRLNQLAIAAHGILYRRKSRKKLPRLWQFLRYDYPVHFRKLWPYTILVTGIFFIGLLGAYVTTRLKPATAFYFVPGSLDIVDEKNVTEEDISERFRQMDRPPMAAGIITNNISVALNAFALGITAGVGTCYLLLYNSLMLGGFIGHFCNYNLGYELLSYLGPHGFLEIFAILVAAASGVRLGLSFALPGMLTRTSSLRKGAIDAVMLVLGTVPMFILAGLVEGFITPSYLPGLLKILLGVSLLLMTLAYLLCINRHPVEKPSEQVTGFDLDVAVDQLRG
jgi:uncharacterized membrane protein SpoIIM required for sporulation